MLITTLFNHTDSTASHAKLSFCYEYLQVYQTRN